MLGATTLLVLGPLYCVRVWPRHGDSSLWFPADPPFLRHTSKHAGRVREEVKSVKHEGKLYGPTKDIKPNPKTFMKKGHGNTIRAKASKRMSPLPHVPNRFTAKALARHGMRALLK